MIKKLLILALACTFFAACHKEDDMVVDKLYQDHSQSPDNTNPQPTEDDNSPIGSGTEDDPY
ncbi:MAG: hypothetical protein KBT04_00275, partial [Bacteroidales bacterium]|nr:hypothetical protein [Candidatus Colimorpha onthohippi]